VSEPVPISTGVLGNEKVWS